MKDRSFHRPRAARARHRNPLSRARALAPGFRQSRPERRGGIGRRRGVVRENRPGTGGSGDRCNRHQVPPPCGCRRRWNRPTPPPSGHLRPAPRVGHGWLPVGLTDETSGKEGERTRGGRRRVWAPRLAVAVRRARASKRLGRSVSRFGPHVNRTGPILEARRDGEAGPRARRREGPLTEVSGVEPSEPPAGRKARLFWPFDGA